MQSMSATNFNASQQSSYVMGIVYDWRNFGGASYTLTSTIATGCATTSFTWVPSSTWDNRVESAQGYANCDTFHMWQNSNQSGANIVCASPCSTFDVLNNQGSRLELFD